MKNFILGIYKNKKWVVLGLSILMIVLFCFPILPASVINTDNFPFFIGLIIATNDVVNDYYYDNSNPPDNESFVSFMEYWDFYKPLLLARAIPIILLMIASIILSILSLTFIFQGKTFYCISFLLTAFFAYIIQGISPLDKTYKLSPIAVIFLILLILDIVYLCLERKYLKEVKQKEIKQEEDAEEESVKTF